jgi:hypothetical protein
MFQTTENLHPNCPLISKPIEDKLVGETTMQFFDKDGYELNKLEQLYYEANDVNISEKHLWHTANHVWWIVDDEPKSRGPVIDHSLINTRWAYSGEAKEQLLDWVDKKPELRKLLMIQPKWGIDFSLDWIDDEEAFELFHIELDRFSFSAINHYRTSAEALILGMDWEAAGQEVKRRKDEWIELSSDDQSDWKVQQFGWHRAFDNRKVLQKQ